MTVPILIPWDLYQGKLAVYSECVAAGVRRAVLLPRLDTVFAPEQEDPAREHEYRDLKWRLVSPTEADWVRYRDLMEKAAERAGIQCRAQRVENLSQWVDGRTVAVPQYHLWLYRESVAEEVIDRLYEASDPNERRGLWRWLLAWTAPAVISGPLDGR